jgi:hypothetical protein
MAVKKAQVVWSNGIGYIASGFARYEVLVSHYGDSWQLKVYLRMYS